MTQSMMLKVSLSVEAESASAGEDLTTCVRELSRECGQADNEGGGSGSSGTASLPNISAPDDVVENKFKLDATIPPNSQQVCHHYMHTFRDGSLYSFWPLCIIVAH